MLLRRSICNSVVSASHRLVNSAVLSYAGHPLQMNCELHAGPFACNGVLELANEFACCICLIDDAELASTHW